MQMQKWFQNINIDEIYNSLRLSVRYMYRVRRGDPQELSVVSGVRCKIRILKILCSILLFPFFIIFFLINNVINKPIIILYYSKYTFYKITEIIYVYFNVLEINCAFRADFWNAAYFSFTTAWRLTAEPLTRGRASQERHSVRNSMLRPYLPANCHENKIK